MKTGQQIEDNVFFLIRDSNIAGFINGGVYKFGLRPRDSQKEDAVVKFVEGVGEQKQEGTVVVNIYVPDFDPFNNGTMVRDVSRCIAIEEKAAQWYKELSAASSDYLFSLKRTIYTEEESELKQHFVNIRLDYKIMNI